MPRGKGEAISERRDNLNVFGVWLWFSMDHLGITMGEVARRTNIHKGTISNMTKVDKGVDRGSVMKIVSVLEAVATEKHLVWSTAFSTALYHAAGFATEQEIGQSENTLKIIQEFANVTIYRRLKQNKVCP